jgi:DNA-binding NtrC family response regulator
MADVLVIHDQAHLRQSLIDHVRRSGHSPFGAADLAQARAGANGVDYAVVLLGTRKGEGSVAAINDVKGEWPTAEIVVIGGSNEMGEATEAVRHGAFDYVATADPVRLGHALRGAAERRWNIAESKWRTPHDEPDESTLLDPVTRTVFVKADRAAAVNSTVLITGESGTGKEVLARRIHRHSNRRRAKFVPVNCGSLPETLIETELFGYRKGAFTGAVSNSRGLIEEAEGGVLFLDEIGDMPLTMQVRLLRFLDSGEIRAVGGTTVKHVDVRVIAATNRCLRSEIRERHFREDLFFRLSVVSLHLPPLRERPDDMPALVQSLARRIATRLGVPAPKVADDAMALLLRYRWPGNIRELQNALEQALVQEPGGLITAHDLPPSVVLGLDETMLPPAPEIDETEQLVTELRRHKGNHTKAAAALGISRTTLWRRLRRRNGAAAPELALLSDASALATS